MIRKIINSYVFKRYAEENIWLDFNLIGFPFSFALLHWKGIRRIFNANRYATKKTLAQGILDLALLASNAAQLKYLLKIGESHEFYTLLLALIVSSICLQVNDWYELWLAVTDLWLESHRKCNCSITCRINILSFANFQVIQAIVCVVLGLILDINNVAQQKIADICNNVCLTIIIVTVAINVIISAFDLKDDGMGHI